MKNVSRSLLVCAVVFSFASIAIAKEPADALIDKYDGKKGFDVTIIGSDMLDMMLQLPILPKEQKKMYEQTDEMVMVSYSGKNPTIESLYNEARGLFDSEGSTYTYTQDINQEGVVGKLFAIEEGETAKEINVVINMGKSFMLIVMKGNYDRESLNEAQKPPKKMF